jgi:hypothetical protein
VSNQTDFADAEVQGLARYLPTALAKSLFVAMFVVPAAVFQVVRSNTDWFLIQSRTYLEQTLIAAIAALVIAVLVSLSLGLELAYIISKKKHRRIVHFVNGYPSLTWRYVAANASWGLLVASIVMLVVSFCLGYAARAWQ